MAGAAGGTPHVYMKNVENGFTDCISNFLQIATNQLNIPYPFQFELGGVGLKGLPLSLPQAHHYRVVVVRSSFRRRNLRSESAQLW